MLVAENTSLVSCKDHHTCPLQAVVPLTGRTSRSSCRLVAPVPSRLQRTCQCPQSGTHAWRLEWDVAALGPGRPTISTCVHNTYKSVSQFRRGPPALTTPSQRRAPLPSVNTQCQHKYHPVLSTRSLGLLNFASDVGLSRHISFDRSLVSLHSSKRSSALSKL